ncbi:hypothetical protein V1477_009643 [Vespula maculifrons]|uniref:Uncharacterized protein n=1 Tax=Vespula maculifrons TaxID=7453 RepID=A0ABD2CAB6_VESMC
MSDMYTFFSINSRMNYNNRILMIRKEKVIVRNEIICEVSYLLISCYITCHAIVDHTLFARHCSKTAIALKFFSLIRVPREARAQL